MNKKLLIIFMLLTIFSCTNFTSAETGAGITQSANWVDVHGAGSQRSDPKTGVASIYSEGFGPQGDSIRIDNLCRAVRTVSTSNLTYPVVDTNQSTRFNNYDVETDNSLFYGQDADYNGFEKSYTDNGDGTVTDNVTGLMWQQDPGEKLTWDEAFEKLESFNLSGYDDWRIPTIKELYSLILFSGRDISPMADSANTPFIDTDYFNFSYGDTSAERIIDAQYMSSTKYVSTTMNGEETVFGVNFADGRIKGYGMNTLTGNGEKTFFVIFVRGNEDYGKNNYVDNNDGTITDLATGLMWMQDDFDQMQWEDALNWAENLEYAGYSDWRLPNVKELESIVDYSRSPDTTNSPAIDPIFNSTVIIDEAGDEDYGYYWSSTTHATENPDNPGKAAAYVAFGKSLGNMSNFDTSGMSGRRLPPPRR